MIRLGVNIDHVATIRNARGGKHPDPIRAAKLAIEAGADGITAHLREDRRHISDNDIDALMDQVQAPLNLEMAATDEMLAIALKHNPHAACIVPEKRQERTTEGGLDATSDQGRLGDVIGALSKANIRVSLFVEPDARQLEAAKHLGAAVVELHTGTYAEASSETRDKELKRLIDGAALADKLGLECHAGHGLTYETVALVAAIPTIAELNIGHFLVGEAVFRGFKEAILRMRALMQEARL
jgi:pyridoxine 5-phosphate synthase